MTVVGMAVVTFVLNLLVYDEIDYNIGKIDIP